MTEDWARRAAPCGWPTCYVEERGDGSTNEHHELEQQSQICEEHRWCLTHGGAHYRIVKMNTVVGDISDPNLRGEVDE